MTDRIVTIERWDPEYSQVAVTVPDGSALAELLGELASERSTMVSIECGERLLVVSVSRGVWAVTVRLGLDDFFDLVGDAGAEGTTPFLQGGQLVDYPRRHVVSQEDAHRAAVEFFNTGTIETDHRWEREGQWLRE